MRGWRWLVVSLVLIVLVAGVFASGIGWAIVAWQMLKLILALMCCGMCAPFWIAVSSAKSPPRNNRLTALHTAWLRRLMTPTRFCRAGAARDGAG